MLADVRLLLWLRVRHARWSAERVMHLAGAGVQAGTRSERAYQLYVLAIVCAFLVAMWAALLDAVEGLFALAGTAACAMAVQAALTVPFAVTAVRGLQGLRTSPLKFSHPDSAFLAASPLDARALVGLAACFQALGAGLAAGLAGFLLGAGLCSAGALAASPFLVALAEGVAVMAGTVAGWLPGVVRLACFASRRKVAAVAVSVLVAVVAAGVAALWLARPDALLDAGFFAAVAEGSVGLLAATAVALGTLAPHADMTVALRESVLFADLGRFGPLSPLGQDAVRDYRRRRKLAARRLRFRLPRGEGPAALVARATLAQVRRYDGLPSLLVQGAVVVPSGVLAIGGVGGPVLFLFWLQALLMMPQGAREATRAFKDDMRNRLVRDRLPFGALSLLVFDSLPAFVLTTVLACAACALAAPPGMPPLAAVGLAVLVNACTLAACGLDAVRLYAHGPRLCYEYGALALVAVAFVLSLFASPAAVAAALAVLCAALAALVRFGVECAW